MAGAKQVEIGSGIGEHFAQRAVGQDFDFFGLAFAAARPGQDFSFEAPVARLMRLGDEGAGAFGGGEGFQFACIARIERLDHPLHPPAAALGEIRPERHRPPQRGAASLRQSVERGAQGLPFERAAADRAIEGARGTHDHARAALARARPLHLHEADERAGAFGFERVDQAVKQQHGDLSISSQKDQHR
jgi:hypothetical protein